MTIEEAMTHEGAEQLGRMADAWLEEALQLEKNAGALLTLDQKIGDILMLNDIAIPMLMRQWDASGDGSITRAEFRLAVRALHCLEKAPGVQAPGV